jgi:PAS domain S-box-containing protein
MSINAQERIQILHVDDEASLRELTATFLEGEDDRFAVETATSADEGLERINDRPPDCVVSDYNMPGMDGIEFLQAVREGYPDLPFILFTGKGSEAVASDAISTGVTDYLQKGVGSEQYELLANRIENAVGTHRSQLVAQRRKERLELFFQESPLGAIEWDEDVRVERLNEQAEDILGYDEAELRGRSWDTIVAADDRDRAGDTAAKLRAAEGGQDAVNRNVRNDGEIRTIQWHNRTITDDDGTVESVFSKFQDITQREKRKSELEEYETIIESLTDAVYVLNEEGRFTYINDEFVELVGYDRERILGSKPALLKTEQTVERAEVQLGRLLSSDGPETVTFEVTVDPCEGEPIVCEDHMGVLPYEGDQFNGSVGTLRDVSDQREREAELRETTKQLQAVMDSVGSAMWIRNADKEYVYMNQQHRDLFDIADATDIAGKQSSDVLPAEVAAQFQRNDQRVYETNEPVTIEETVETDEGPREFLTRIVPLFEEGSLYATCGIATDVTEQKEHEAELQTQNKRLEEFVSIVSHDLRNPLQVADGRLELIRTECESEYIDDVAQALDRMDALIEDLLTLARGGDMVGELEPIGLAAIAESSWETAETGSATFETHATGTLRTDRSRLQELLENLYHNAVEHGGDSVTVSVGAIDDGFYVADTGPGISESEREEIFEAGYSTNDGGTGFGLRIVEQIADAHGWEITVTASEQGGTRFAFTGVQFEDC